MYMYRCTLPYVRIVIKIINNEHELGFPSILIYCDDDLNCLLMQT